MAKGKTIDNTALVTEFIGKQDADKAALLEAVRQSILSSDEEVGEQIKWNSPSFYYNGEMKPFNPKEYKRDIVVVNLHRGHPLMVFPTGAKVEHDPQIANANNLRIARDTFAVVDHGLGAVVSPMHHIV